MLLFNIRGFIFPLPTKLRFFSLHFFFKITLTSFPFLSYLSFRTVNPDFWGRLSHDAIVSYQEIHLPNIHSVMFHRFCCGNRIWTDWDYWLHPSIQYPTVNIFNYRNSENEGLFYNTALQLYAIIMTPKSFTVNLHFIACLNVKELLAWSRYHIWSLTDRNEIQTRSHLLRKRTLNHLAKLGRWLSVRLRTKWLWVRIPLLSLKLFSNFGLSFSSLFFFYLCYFLPLKARNLALWYSISV